MIESEMIKKIDRIFKKNEEYFGKILYSLDVNSKNIRIGYIEKIPIKPSQGILKNNKRLVTLKYEKFVKRTRSIIKQETGIEFSFVYDEEVYIDKQRLIN